MNDILASLKISTKILVLLLMLGAVTVAVAFAGSKALITADDANTVMVGEAKATVLMARANRHATEVVFAATRAMANDGASREAQAASAAEQTAYDSGEALLAKATTARPRLKAEIAGFDSQLDEMHRIARQAISLGLQNKHAAAAILITQLNTKADVLSKQMAAANDAMLKADDDAAAALTTVAQSTKFWLLTLSLAGVAISIGISLVVSRIGVTAPLGRIAARMNEIATGNFGGDVTCSQRRDELGAMGKAVQVFRDNGIAKAAADADKVEADAAVQMVVTTLGASLTDLSNRDLTTRVTAEYPGLYAELKDNYNEAIDSVRTTIEQVSESARTISTGADEIAQASEDLARRTESNAASLEETSAALTQMEGRLKATATASVSTVARADQAMATVDSGRSTAECGSAWKQ